MGGKASSFQSNAEKKKGLVAGLERIFLQDGKNQRPFMTRGRGKGR